MTGTSPPLTPAVLQSGLRLDSICIMQCCQPTLVSSTGGLCGHAFVILSQTVTARLVQDVVLLSGVHISTVKYCVNLVNPKQHLPAAESSIAELCLHSMRTHLLINTTLEILILDNLNQT